MAVEIKKERVLANFRPSLAEKQRRRRKAKADAYANRDGNDLSHLEDIRRLPCLACMARTNGTKLTTPVDPHHLKCGPAAGERGAAQRATDRWAVPACRVDHDELERLGSRREAAWWAGMGIPEPWEIAAALWRLRGDRDAMFRVMLAHTRN